MGRSLTLIKREDQAVSAAWPDRKKPWPFFSLFQDGGRPHDVFLKVRNISSPVRRPSMCHHAKFCADRSNHCGDMADFRFFKMAAVRHLGFVLRVWTTYEG